MRRPFAAFAVALALGCGADVGSDAVLVSDARYRVVLRSAPAPTTDAAGTLHVTVETTNGWQVADEAPARLDLQTDASLAFEPSALRQADVRSKSQHGFEFVTTVTAADAGSAVGRGRLKFGICDGPKAKCVIVRRDLELPIEVAAGD